MSENRPLIRIRNKTQIDKVWEYEADIDARAPIIQDHRIQQQVIVAGACWIECLMQAIMEFRPNQYQINALSWLTPYLVTKDLITIKIKIRDNQIDQELSISSTLNEQELTHVKARFKSLNDPGAQALKRLSVDNIKQKAVSTLLHEDIYHQLAQLGFHYGPHYQLIERAYCALDFTLVELRSVSDAQAYWFHPGIVDAALQSCLGMAYVKGGNEQAHLPFSIKGIKSYRPLVDTRYIYAMRNPGSSPVFLSYHLMFLNEHGEVILFMHDFIGRQAGFVQAENSPNI